MDVFEKRIGDGRAAQDQHALREWIYEAYGNLAPNSDPKVLRLCAENTVQFAKTAALFTPTIWGRAATAAIYAADEVQGKTHQQIITDACLGAVKGVAMRGLNECTLGAVHPMLQGAALGMASRVSDVALSRMTYQPGNVSAFDGKYGMTNIVAELADRDSLVADIAVYSGARVIMPHLSAEIYPRAAATMSGGVYGLMGGAVEEIRQQQQRNEKFDVKAVAGNALMSAWRDGSASAMGASMFRRDGQSGRGMHEVKRERNAHGEDEPGKRPIWKESRVSEPALPEPPLPEPQVPWTCIDSRRWLDRRDDGDRRSRSERAPGGGDRPERSERTGDDGEHHPRSEHSAAGGDEHPDETLRPVDIFGHAHPYLEEQHTLLQKFSNRLPNKGCSEIITALAQIDARVTLGDLHPHAVKEIMTHVDKLLTPDNVLPSLRADSVTLAKQLLLQVGNPKLVQQGDCPSCSVAAMEHRMYVRDAHKAVKLVVDAATTGGYVPEYGHPDAVERGSSTNVTVNELSLRPEPGTLDPYALEHCMRRRSWASQIFQYVATNIHWQNRPGDLTYEYREKAKQWHVIDCSQEGKAPRMVHDYPHLDHSDVTDIYATITGNDHRCHYTGDSFKSADEFKAKLEDLAKQRGLPLIITVDARHKPFYELLPASTRRNLTDESHSHDICIDGYNARTNTVTIFNSWGRLFHPYGIDADILYHSLARRQKK